MYLGIDIGTSSVKAVLIDADQRIVASRSEPLDGGAPASRLVGAGPGKLGRGDLERDRRALPRHIPSEMKRRASGIGLSGHMHGATLLDKADRPLRPCILWNDGRSAKEAAELDADPRFRADHRQYRLSGLHRAEARLGAPARAEDLRRSRARCCCRRTTCGCGSRATTPPTCRIPPARPGSTWRSATGRTSCSAATHLASRPDAGAVRRAREPTGKLRARARQPLGHDERPGDRRRRRRQRRLGLRRRHGRARLRLRLARHVGRALRLQREIPAECGERRPRLLPCAARTPGTRWA